MLKIVLLLYAIVVLLGLYLLIQRIRKRKVGLLVGILHGAFGLGGIAPLIIVSSYKDSHSPTEAIILLFIAFMIGGGMFCAKVFAGKSSLVVILIHAIVALTGVYFLLQFSSIIN